MVERIKIKKINDSPANGMYITKKDAKILIISLSVIVFLYAFTSKIKCFFKYKINV